MVKPNYAFAKRQRDIAKKQKKEEKRQGKASSLPSPDDESLPQAADDEQAPPAAADGSAEV